MKFELFRVCSRMQKSLCLTKPRRSFGAERVEFEREADLGEALAVLALDAEEAPEEEAFLLEANDDMDLDFGSGDNEEGKEGSRHDEDKRSDLDSESFVGSLISEDPLEDDDGATSPIRTADEFGSPIRRSPIAEGAGVCNFNCSFHPLPRQPSI